METTTTKFWPIDKVPPSAIYIGSCVCEKEKQDVYYDKGCGFVVWGDGWQWGRFCQDQITGDWLETAKQLLRAHLAKQSAPPAPAMSREQMIEAAAKAAQETPDGGGHVYRWDDAADSDRFDRRREQEAALLAVGAIQPLPKPAPVEAKTETPEEMAARIITEANGHIYVCAFRLVDGATRVRIRLAEELEKRDAARDAAHQTALAGLRESLIKTACDWYLLFGIGHGSSWKDLEEKMRQVPLTLSAE